MNILRKNILRSESSCPLLAQEISFDISRGYQASPRIKGDVDNAGDMRDLFGRLTGLVHTFEI